MKTIHKYPLRVDAVQTIFMPEGANVLTVQLQRNQPCLWALVDTQGPMIPRTFWMCGTGHNAEALLGTRYVGTYQLSGGELVLHVFEVLP